MLSLWLQTDTHTTARFTCKSSNEEYTIAFWITLPRCQISAAILKIGQQWIPSTDAWPLNGLRWRKSKIQRWDSGARKNHQGDMIY